MSERVSPESLEVIPNDLIKPNHVAWFDRTKTIFMLQPFDTDAAMTPNRAYGVYVHPSSYKEFMDRLTYGQFNY